MKISVDFGHCLSGYDTGASGCGYREEVLTREVGKLVVNKLRALGHEVLAVDLERSHSVNSSLAYRKDAINTFKPDLSISIHFNAGGGIGGIEIYTDGYCDAEAVRVLNNFANMGYSNRGIKDGMQLALVGGINHYAMLIECCFINIQGDMDKYNAEKFANNIVNGILNRSNAPTPIIKYQGHIQGIGWQEPKGNNEIAGTTGQELRLEALTINYPNVLFRCHIQNLGWTNYRSSGEIIGTMGSSLRLEAIEILSDKLAFSVHIEGQGWTDYKTNAVQGTTGQARRIEAIRIKEI